MKVFVLSLWAFALYMAANLWLMEIQENRELAHKMNTEQWEHFEELGRQAIQNR